MQATNDSYAHLLGRLSARSVTKKYDAYADVGWDDPEHRIEQDDPRFELEAGEPLGRSAFYRALPQATRARIGLQTIAYTMKTGVQFEGTQHSLMFQEFVNRTGMDVTGLGLLERIGARGVPALGRTCPERFFIHVLAGETPIDWVQRRMLATGGARHPLLRRIIQIHVTEEARHLCFATRFLRENVPRMGAFARARLHGAAMEMARRVSEQDLARRAKVVTLPPAAPMSRRTTRNHGKIGWYGHAVVYASTGLFLFVVVPMFAAVVVMLSWTIALATHGFFAVVAPALRRRWADAEGEPSQGEPLPGARRLDGARRALSLERLSASIAHEIRNPITAAKSLVAQMGEDPQRPENVEYARVALEELDRVERSIAHLLRFARDEELDVREVDVAELMGSALETLETRIADGQVTVTRDFEEAGRLHADLSP